MCRKSIDYYISGTNFEIHRSAGPLAEDHLGQWQDISRAGMSELMEDLRAEGTDPRLRKKARADYRTTVSVVLLDSHGPRLRNGPGTGIACEGNWRMCLGNPKCANRQGNCDEKSG